MECTDAVTCWSAPNIKHWWSMVLIGLLSGCGLYSAHQLITSEFTVETQGTVSTKSLAEDGESSRQSLILGGRTGVHLGSHVTVS